MVGEAPGTNGAPGPSGQGTTDSERAHLGLAAGDELDGRRRAAGASLGRGVVGAPDGTAHAPTTVGSDHPRGASRRCSSSVSIGPESGPCRPAGPHARPVASAAIAPTVPHRIVGVVLAAAWVLAACSSGGGDRPERAATSSTTTVAEPRCPDGSTVPGAEPAADVPAAGPRPSGPDARDGALDIATLLPRTGDLAFLGAAAFAGVELAVADLDAAGGVLGAPVGLRHGDSAEGTPGTAESEVARLLGAGADVVVGPLSSATAARVLEPVAADAVLVTPGASSGGLDALDRTGRLFRTGPTEALQGRALADLLSADGHRTVSVAARADDYGRAVADALAARLEEAGATVTGRADYDPSAPDLGQDVVGRLDTAADAIVVVGLAESALVLDALVDAGEGPRDRPVYGTDGNLGDRLGDLVADAGDLACLRGLLPVATPAPDFAERVRDHAPGLADAEGAALDLAAEAYDAAVVVALAAEAARSDAAEDVAASMAAVTDGGTPCRSPAACLDLIAAGVDLAYVGATGRSALGPDGNPTEAGLTLVAFDAEGHLARLGSRRARG